MDTTAFFESIVLIAILAFASTIALSRFVERGVVIVRDRERR
jgi:multicomponent Na+:H+ antiporter subunit F